MPDLPPLHLIREILWQVMVPAGGASLVVLLLVLVCTRGRAGRIGLALALAASVVVGMLAAEEWHQRGIVSLTAPEQGWTFLPWLALAAVLIGIPPAGGSSRSVNWGQVVGLAILAAWLVIPATAYQDDKRPLVFFGLAVAAGAISGDLAGRRHPGGGLPLTLAFMLLGGAAVLIHAHSARLTDLALIFTAAVAGLALPCWIWKVDAAPAGFLAAVVLPALMFTGMNETDSAVPTASFYCVGLAPLGLLVAVMPPFSRMTGLLRAVLLFLTLVPVVVAVVLAMRAESLPVL